MAVLILTLLLWTSSVSFAQEQPDFGDGSNSNSNFGGNRRDPNPFRTGDFGQNSRDDFSQDSGFRDSNPGFGAADDTTPDPFGRAGGFQRGGSFDDDDFGRRGQQGSPGFGSDNSNDDRDLFRRPGSDDGDQTTPDPFRTTTPRTTPTTTTFRSSFGNQDDFNRFQNSENPRERPQGGPGSFRRRPGGGLVGSGQGGVRNRPQVDEFGNPLEEIHSVDTTRFELGDGVDAREVRCPRNWHRFDRACYKFTRSPIKRWDDARLICQAFKHQDQDSADLASISTLEEHRFIEMVLNDIDPQHRRWYISTRQEGQDTWVNQDQTQMLNLQEYFLKVVIVDCCCCLS